eukprot:Nitzschia sp. Nitz4//scaffold297_size22919//7187//8512//NITZ4_008521-RA/size22919-processed-gene-0.13-mRNA-1//1//CDS//3329546298//8871//frame0
MFSSFHSPTESNSQKPSSRRRIKYIPNAKKAVQEPAAQEQRIKSPPGRRRSSTNDARKVPAVESSSESELEEEVTKVPRRGRRRGTMSRRRDIDPEMIEASLAKSRERSTVKQESPKREKKKKVTKPKDKTSKSKNGTGKVKKSSSKKETTTHLNQDDDQSLDTDDIFGIPFDDKEDEEPGPEPEPVRIRVRRSDKKSQSSLRMRDHSDHSRQSGGRHSDSDPHGDREELEPNMRIRVKRTDKKHGSSRLWDLGGNSRHSIGNNSRHSVGNSSRNSIGHNSNRSVRTEELRRYDDDDDSDDSEEDLEGSFAIDEHEDDDDVDRNSQSPRRGRSNSLTKSPVAAVMRRLSVSLSPGANGKKKARLRGRKPGRGECTPQSDRTFRDILGDSIHRIGESLTRSTHERSSDKILKDFDWDEEQELTKDELECLEMMYDEIEDLDI